ncbi:MAG: ribonuclease HII [Candidatus Omnitrophica bacterium]|nr:ribonuclease HII [Candidatus Omnitrophota bacterium]
MPQPADDPRSPDRAARAEGFRRLAGVDEAGRGPWAGPVVASAVVLVNPEPLPVRIDDSKRLTPGQRERAAGIILARAEVGVGILSADEIDSHDILRASLLAMRRAVEALPNAPDLVLVDGAIAPRLGVPCRAIIAGDRRSYAIACASIIAKVVRDELMVFYHTLYPQYAFARHKGYGTALHLAQLRRWGPSPLHRLSFRPVAEEADARALA